MAKVKFIKDFGVKRVGDISEYDNSICSQLVNYDKVAEYTSEEITLTSEEREYIDPDLEINSTEEITLTSEETDKKAKK